jgi:4-hydroxybenzoate polyprenyltransferase
MPGAVKIARALRDFAAERFPIGVALALSFALCVGPYAIVGGEWSVLPRAVAAAFLVLFVLRIADDVLSIDDDRVASPERSLPVGRISLPALWSGALALAVVALVVSFGWLSLALVLLALYYAGYFSVAERVPVAVRPVLVNVVFLLIPLSIGLLQGDVLRPVLWMIGLFFWLAAIGHDYAHSVHDESESTVGVATCSRILGPRTAAAIGLACYVGAFVVGLLAGGLRGLEGPHVLFLIGLTVLFAHVAFLCGRLIREPSRARARRLYVSGVCFFAVPSLLLGVDRLLGV